LRFGYHWANPTLRSDWQSLVWDDGMRAMLPADVPPGGTASLTLRVKAPAKPHADYKLVIAPLLEGTQGGWTTTTPHVANVAVL
ncbi:MAG TPA: hypothetical protein VFW15_09950, partial [Thermoanaerobaculia bacterium]|nr:hypothetical protein [Thermoanaerobaculia bacterium]